MTKKKRKYTKDKKKTVFHSKNILEKDKKIWCFKEFKKRRYNKHV